MQSAKDMLTEHNVIETYNENKYVVFVLKNGIRVKLDPNKDSLGSRKESR